MKLDLIHIALPGWEERGGNKGLDDWPGYYCKERLQCKWMAGEPSRAEETGAERRGRRSWVEAGSLVTVRTLLSGEMNILDTFGPF